MEFGRDTNPSEHKYMFCGVRNQTIPELVCTSREVPIMLSCASNLATGAYKHSSSYEGGGVPNCGKTFFDTE